MVWFVVLAVLFLVALGVVAWWLSHRDRRQDPVAPPPDGECCGAHAVCERDSLLARSSHIDYYDDEELDALAGLSPEIYTDEQLRQLAEVFYTLREQDVAGWLRSLQARNIQLPEELREEALLIVSERRKA